MAEPDELTDQDRQILKFESQRWKQRGSKESAIRDEFRMTPTQYYQALSRLITRPQALEYDPVLVGQLTRQRDQAIGRKYVRGGQ